MSEPFAKITDDCQTATPRSSGGAEDRGRAGGVRHLGHGDGQCGTRCIRLRDATGQVHQVRGEPVSWKGWRYVTFPLRPAADCRQSRQKESAAYSVSGQTMIPLPDASAEQRVSWGHWGGVNDGEVHGPIEWDCRLCGRKK